MKATYLKHPQHGAHIVYDHGDLARCMKNGWVLDENQPEGGEKPAGPTVAPAADFRDSAPVRVVGVDTDGDGKIDQVFKKKPGRPKKGA